MNYEGAKCDEGHDLEIISEGYGLCYNPKMELWHAWAFCRPVNVSDWDYDGWCDSTIQGRAGPITAWVTFGDTRDTRIARIQADINAHRSMPFDEERERARLMPV